MSDQVLSLRTIYGWFSVLAAMTRFGATDDGPAQLMAGASVPVAVVDLESRSVLAMSDRFRALLGRSQTWTSIFWLMTQSFSARSWTFWPGVPSMPMR